MDRTSDVQMAGKKTRLVHKQFTEKSISRTLSKRYIHFNSKGAIIQLLRTKSDRNKRSYENDIQSEKRYFIQVV